MILCYLITITPTTSLNETYVTASIQQILNKCKALIRITLKRFYNSEDLYIKQIKRILFFILEITFNFYAKNLEFYF